VALKRGDVELADLKVGRAADGDWIENFLRVAQPDDGKIVIRCRADDFRRDATPTAGRSRMVLGDQQLLVARPARPRTPSRCGE
jgi:hypothetical protein